MHSTKLASMDVKLCFLKPCFRTIHSARNNYFLSRSLRLC